MSSDRPSIALAMIVRDEELVIERCLGSVRSLIDSWTIIDTGSADRTADVVQQCLAEIPGQLLHRPWHDFSTNRNELLVQARPTADYLLLLDADMTVRICTDAPLQQLTHPAYDIVVEAGLRYRMPYLVAAGLPCAYVGRTHESLDLADLGILPVPLDDIVITHHGDGGARAIKMQRDLALLEADARADPENARIMFYLAQTRAHCADPMGALAAYRRRIELGGWDEEIFWSMYQCGQILDASGDWPAAAQMYITAWEFRPHRVEPIVQLSRGYRQAGAVATALMWSQRGTQITMPEHERLFVEPQMYRTGIALEQAANLWWTGDTAAAHSNWRQLLGEDDLSEADRQAILGNLELPG